MIGGRNGTCVMIKKKGEVKVFSKNSNNKGWTLAPPSAAHALALEMRERKTLLWRVSAVARFLVDWVPLVDLHGTLVGQVGVELECVL